MGNLCVAQAMRVSSYVPWSWPSLKATFGGLRQGFLEQPRSPLWFTIPRVIRKWLCWFQIQIWILALWCFLGCNAHPFSLTWRWDASGRFFALYLAYLIDLFTEEMSTARNRLNEFHVLRFLFVLLATYGRLNHWKEVLCFNGLPGPAKLKVQVIGILQWYWWSQLFTVRGWGGITNYMLEYHQNSSWKIDVWNKRFLLEFFVSCFHLIFWGAVQFHLRRKAKK